MISRSAVGLFFGFFVSATFTKLWKFIVLQIIQRCMFNLGPYKKSFFISSAYVPFFLVFQGRRFEAGFGHEYESPHGMQVEHGRLQLR
jgi:hypothetical protein